MTLPKPPLPRNCRSSNLRFTRDCPRTPEMYEKSGTGSSRSGWSTRCDGPSSPAFALFLSTSCWPCAKLPYMTEVKNECSRSWDADHRFLSSVVKQLRRRRIIKARIHTFRWESFSCMNFVTTISHKLCQWAKLVLQNNSELLEFVMHEKWVLLLEFRYITTWKGSLANLTAMKQIFLSRLQRLHLRQPKRERVGPWEKKSLSAKIFINLKRVQHPRCLFYVGINNAEPNLFSMHVCMF